MTEQDFLQAQKELKNLKFMLIHAKNNPALGANISIAHRTAGVSVNSRLLPIIEAEIEEIEKYLRGEVNNYE